MTRPTKSRKVKAWLLVEEFSRKHFVFTGEHNQLRAYKTKADMQRDGWSIYATDWSPVPCTITYSLPITKKRKAK